jgi:PLP dependent protein
VAAREAFTVVGRLADALGLEERSMGMTDDLEAAVVAGSTMLRVGRALFGPRPARGARDARDPGAARGRGGAGGGGDPAA